MSDTAKQIRTLILYAAVFAAVFYLPLHWERFANAVGEALALARWYAREHVVLCLLPAFFIAGAIGVFINSASVMRYLGPRAPKPLAYGVASVSGSVLAVCSCTVLPLFAGIHRMGAGIGPATAFLYSGPAINVLAIILTASVLGPRLGIARAVGAVVFAIVIGLAMAFIYRKEEKPDHAPELAVGDDDGRPLWQTALFLVMMLGVLVFANWSTKAGPALIAGNKWLLTAGFAIGLAATIHWLLKVAWWKLLAAAAVPAALALLTPAGELWVLLSFGSGVAALAVVLATAPAEGREWLAQSWGFARQILPLLLAGVLVAGFLLGGPKEASEGLIPPKYVDMLVGAQPEAFIEATGAAGWAEGAIRTAWPVWTNFFASIFGAAMYFATLTEVPILKGLTQAGMAPGPALALLLAGPALSLPNMLVIASVLGARKTATFVTLVVVMATLTGLLYGALGIGM